MHLLRPALINANPWRVMLETTREVRGLTPELGAVVGEIESRQAAIRLADKTLVERRVGVEGHGSALYAPRHAGDNR